MYRLSSSDDKNLYLIFMPLDHETGNLWNNRNKYKMGCWDFFFYVGTLIAKIFRLFFKKTKLEIFVVEIDHTLKNIGFLYL